MKTSKNPTPEQMTIICNIQMLWDALSISHNEKDFYGLCELSANELHEMQNSLIPAYNNNLKNSNK